MKKPLDTYHRRRLNKFYFITSLRVLLLASLIIYLSISDMSEMKTLLALLSIVVVKQFVEIITSKSPN